MHIKKKRKIRTILILSILGVTTTFSGFYIYGILNRTINSPIVHTTIQSEKWAADLTYVKNELPKRHYNLFFSKSKSAFNTEMDLLISKAKEYDDTKIKAELAKIIASVNDSHTSVNIQGSLIYPISFFQFDEGIYLINTLPEYKDLWGKKLVGVNGYSMDQIHSKLDPYLSHDNSAIVKNQFCNSFKFVETLKIAGITEGNDTTFTFEDNNSKSIVVKPLESTEYQKIKSLAEMPEFISKFPIVKHDPNKNYWFQYLEQNSTVYVKYNSCTDISDDPFNRFTKDVFDCVDTKKAKKLIIDLRDNGGGNSAVFEPFFNEINKRSNINKKENLFVVIGRKTFSSAILNAMDLKKFTNATLIGEPTGGKPNHFGEVKTIHLSNVNVDVNYSSNYFKTSDNETDSLYPDIEVHFKQSSFFNGIDDCLDYVFSRSGHE